MFLHVFDHSLDVKDHAAVKVLHASFLGDVRGHAKVDENVLHVGPLVRLETSQNDKSAAVVNLLGNGLESFLETGQGEGLLGNIIRAEIAGKSC